MSLIVHGIWQDYALIFTFVNSWFHRRAPYGVNAHMWVGPAILFGSGRMQRSGLFVAFFFFHVLMQKISMSGSTARDKEWEAFLKSDTECNFCSSIKLLHSLAPLSANSLPRPGNIAIHIFFRKSENFSLVPGSIFAVICTGKGYALWKFYS